MGRCQIFIVERQYNEELYFNQIGYKRYVFRVVLFSRRLSTENNETMVVYIFLKQTKRIDLLKIIKFFSHKRSVKVLKYIYLNISFV